MAASSRDPSWRKRVAAAVVVAFFTGLFVYAGEDDLAYAIFFGLLFGVACFYGAPVIRRLSSQRWS